MSCNCMNEMLDELSENVKQKLDDNADLGTFSIKYDNRIFRLDGRKNDVMIGLTYRYYKMKTSGEHYKNKTREHVSLAMSYRPFCGKKYD